MEEFFQLRPSCSANCEEDPWKIKCHFFDDLIGLGNLVVDVEVDEANVVIEEFIWHILRPVFCHELWKYLMRSYPHKLIAIFQEVQQHLRQVSLAVFDDD